MKNVLVTGSSKGLGFQICKNLLNTKLYRIICISRNISPELAELIKKKPKSVSFIKFNLENIDLIPQLISQINNEYGDIFGLINNAAIGIDGLLATMHQSDINRIIKINLESPIVMTKYACRTMLNNREGRVINISSIIASSGFNGLSVYGATKSGLEGFTRSLSRELGKVNITVNCIAPGFMETDMTSKLKGKKLDSIKRRAPLGLPLPDEVATSVRFLLSRDANMISGSVITVDGGSSA